MKKLVFILLVLITLFSCENQDWEFDDFDYTTTYFAYQYPVRTIVLGEDIFDTTLDNQHKCKIMAATGGAYTNKNDIVIDFKVDNTLGENLLFKDNNEDIMVMPSNYYSLASNQIKIPKGEISGGVEVQLNDAFFADPLSIKRTYVIPLVMTGAQQVDSILRGNSTLSNPNRLNPADWNVSPKDYTLYAVKFINTWHANYLRRGKDIVKGKTDPSLDKTIIRHKQFVEKDEVCNLSTRSLNIAEFPLDIQDKDGYNVDCTLLLTFDDSGKCTISSEDYPVTGTGQFVEKGEKNSWDGKDRNALYLSYEIDLNDIKYITTDTLVVRDRGISLETYIPILK